jgi:hypothetical protein
MKTRRHGSGGQTLVIFTLVLVTLLGAMALCTDVAVLYFNWAQLQKAADAAAVAGAHYLPNDTSTATSTAITYAGYDGVPSSQVLSVTFGNANSTITVKLQRTVSFFFARVLGFLNTPVTVQATAMVQPAGGTNGMFPIGLSCTGTDPTTDCGCSVSLVNGVATTTCTLHYGMISGAPGNWEPLAIGGNGANVLRNNIAYGYSGTTYIGQGVYLPTEPGNIVGPIAQGMQIRLSNSAYSDGAPPVVPLNNLELNDSRAVVVPMVSFAGSNGKSMVPVLGFGEMWISSFDPSTDNINVYFMGTVDPNAIPGGGTPNGTTPTGVTLIQ